MKTKLLFTILCIFLVSTFQVFSTVPAKLNQEMPTETQIANGKVLTVKVQSQAIANNMLGDSEIRKVSIYLPPGYDENADKNYPVIYMLSDFNGTNEDWFHTFGEFNFPRILDKNIQSGKMKPVIMVFPDGLNKYGGSWYTNSAVGGNWEDFIVTEVVNYMDENFRTLPFAVSRGIAGKGMGAFGALKLATKYPGKFSCVYSLNAMVDLETLIKDKHIWSKSINAALEASSYPANDALANQMLGMAVAFAPNQNKPALMGNLPLTEPGNIENDVFDLWLQNDPLQMISENIENLKALKSITIDCSTSDAGIMLNSNYAETLSNHGINNSFTYFQGSENSVLLNRVTQVMLPMFNHNLAHSLIEYDSKPWYSYSDVLKVNMICDGDIYVIPLNGEKSGISDLEAYVIKSASKTNTDVEIPLMGLEKGIYKMFGISQSGFTGQTYLFGLNGGTPQLKVCVTDSYTGEKLKLCQLTVNDKVCAPEQVVDAEGKTIICAGSENYSTLTKSVMIYTDTTLYISLVKNSQLQVIEKGYGMPIFEATVTQGNQATLTGRDGFTTLYNVEDEILDCRIFKPGYFTEVVHTPIIPGSTKVVELTQKKANVFFYVMSNEGPKFGVYVNLGDISYYSQNNGKVSFTELDTRVEYTYSVNDFNYKEVNGSFFLEHDTIISIYLQPKEIKTGFTAKDGQITTDTREIPDFDLRIYPNPAKTSVTVETNCINGFTVELRTETGSLLQKSKIDGTLHRIDMSNLSNGVYFVTVKTDNSYRTQRIMKL